MDTQRRTPAILATAATTLVGAASGSLGGPIFGIAGAAVGALWGIGLVSIAARLSRSQARRQAWANGSLFVAVLTSGIVTGSAFMGQLLMTAALDSRPQVFAELIRGSVGLAEALPFYIFNTPIEWILAPAALLLTWNSPRRRRLVLAALILWTIHRVWTYTYFVPLISEWSEATPDTPMTADQLDQARTWVNLSWIRGAIDITTTVLVLLAAMRPANGSGSEIPPSTRRLGQTAPAPTA